jgi:hypothetical protein
MTTHLCKNEILSIQSIKRVPPLLKYSLLQARNRLGRWDRDVKIVGIAFTAPEFDFIHIVKVRVMQLWCGNIISQGLVGQLRHTAVFLY